MFCVAEPWGNDKGQEWRKGRRTQGTNNHDPFEPLLPFCPSKKTSLPGRRSTTLEQSSVLSANHLAQSTSIHVFVLSGLMLILKLRKSLILSVRSIVQARKLEAKQRRTAFFTTIYHTCGTARTQDAHGPVPSKSKKGRTVLCASLHILCMRAAMRFLSSRTLSWLLCIFATAYAALALHGRHQGSLPKAIPSNIGEGQENRSLRYPAS